MICFCCFQCHPYQRNFSDGRDLKSSNVAVSFEGQLLHKVIHLKQYSSLHWISHSSSFSYSYFKAGLPRWCSGKESTFQCRGWKRCRFDPLVGKIPWRGKWQPIPLLLPGKFHGQRRATVHGVSKELDMTEHEHFYQSLSSIYFEAKTTRDTSVSICSTFYNWILEWIEPWRRKWQHTPVFLPGKSHGQRSLAGYNPWGCQEPGMT